MKQLFRLFLFLALCASSALAQETNRGFFLPSSGDCGSINNPVTDGAACLQTITANGRTAGTIYIYKGSVTGWQAGSGSGVTDFSSGNLSPLFTTSVATSTTTPALSFSLSTAAANTVLGNATSSTGPPSYGQIVAGQIASNAVTTAKILDANVTLAKIANAAAASKLLGSGASGSGTAYAEITLGTNLSMTGTTLNGAGGTTPITLGSQSLTVTLANDTSTGTTAGLLIKVNSSNQAVTIGTSDTTGIFGICVDIAGASTACGTTGSSTIAVLGTASCQFDGATTAGHFVIASTTSAGKCHDGGATYPATVAVLGTVQSTNGAGGTYSMFFQTPDVTSASNTPSGGGRGTSVLVNGSALSSVRGSLNDTTPVATAGNKLVTWQKDTANPTLISAQVSASGLLDVLGTTRGSILYRGASGWTPLVPNTAGFVLTDGGVGADPAWSSAGSGTVTGTGSANRIAMWSGTSALTSSAQLTVDNAAGIGALTLTRALNVALNVTSSSNEDSDVFVNSGSATARVHMNGTNGKAYFGTSSGNDVFLVRSNSEIAKLDSARHVQFTTSSPTVTNTSSDSCGTTAATLNGNDMVGKVTVGATSGTSCTVTFATAWALEPSCTVTNETTANLARATSTTTTVILAGTFVAGDVLAYTCFGKF